jgi:hypothetical protein
MTSKHRKFDHRGEHIPGKCRIFANSGIRKLQRAMRQGKVPDERWVLITAAAERAEQRYGAYLNSSPAKDKWLMAEVQKWKARQ